MTQPKILLLDIETAPILANVWRTFKENVGFDQIEKDWYILSFAAKWLGNDNTIYFDQRRKRNIEDDLGLMRKLHAIMSKADVVVAHNGKKFDVRKIKARFIMNGLPPLPPFRIVDTLLVARQEFAFTSNRLAALTKQLVPEHAKDDHVEFPGFELWKQCLLRNPRAWEVMEQYNRQDVIALEALYLKLRPWMTGHPNVGAYIENHERPVCPKCGGTHMVQRGYQMTQAGKYVRYRCSDCGAWARGRYTENANAVRKNLLTQ